MINRTKRVAVTSWLTGRCLLWGTVCALCAVLIGCNGYSSSNDSPSTSSTSTAGGRQATPRAPATTAGVDPQTSAQPQPSDDSGGPNGGDDDWKLGKEMSPMDGEIIQAERAYKFANDSDMVAQVQFSCFVQKHQLVIKIGSYVGGTDHPTKASAYQTSVSPITGSLVPDGRVKFATFDPVPFANYFNVGNFANIAEMDIDSQGEIPIAMDDKGVVDLSLGGILGYYAQLKHINIDGRKLDQNPLKGFADGRNAYNQIAALGYLFPVAIEIINGRSTFDFVIDKSDAIDTVLDSCGADRPVIDPSLLLSDADLAARASSQAEQAALDAATGKWRNGYLKMDHLADLLQRYAADHPARGAPNSYFGSYPASLQDPDFASYAQPADLIDPYGHPYAYVRNVSGYKQSFQLTYYGADGVPGGTGVNKDCTFSGGTNSSKDSCH